MGKYQKHTYIAGSLKLRVLQFYVEVIGFYYVGAS